MSATTRLLSAGSRLLGFVLPLACGLVPVSTARAADSARFDLVRTAGLPQNCAANATASARIQPLGFAEKLTVTVSGLPAGTRLDLFATQVPNAPFGVAWYVGDLDVGKSGKVTRSFIGRFNVETFAVAVGAAPVPLPAHDGRDASGNNPTFKPIHTYHLGIWFNSPADAKKAGAACPTGTTPFNGEHTAGVQVLNTGGFPDRNGPLRGVR